jgi:heterodisulfide reductase subunit B
MSLHYLYYPGCSLESNARAYGESLLAILEPLGLELEEIEDWNCCGATEYVGLSVNPAYALIGRNLALAAKQAKRTDTVVAPCSACYLNLAKADHFMRERPLLGVNVNKALAAGGLSYTPGTLQIRHVLDVIINDVGLDKVRERVTRPLKNLRVAPYLGCMVPRPDYEHRWSDAELPTELDRLLKALGADVIDYPQKAHCCGGHMAHIGPETAYEMIRRLIASADQLHADMLVTLCPMCQMNLDAYQGETNRYFNTSYHMPTLYFTQLMGLAFGIEPRLLGFGLELVSAAQALNKIGVEAPVEEVSAAPKPRPAKKTGLPMPRMPGAEEDDL